MFKTLESLLNSYSLGGFKCVGLNRFQVYRTLGDYMISASGSFEDFMEQFKKRHAKDYGLSGGSVAVKAPMAKVVVKAPEIKPEVAKAAVVEEDWDAAEVVEAEESENWWDR